MDLYKLPNLDKRADSGAISVYIYPASGHQAIQLVQSVSEARWTLTVGHTGVMTNLIKLIYRYAIHTNSTTTALIPTAVEVNLPRPQVLPTVPLGLDVGVVSTIPEEPELIHTTVVVNCRT